MYRLRSPLFSLSHGCLPVAHHFKIIKQLLVQCTDLSSPSAMVASQWLGLRLQFLGVAMVTGVAFIAVLEHHFSTVDPGINVCSQCLGWSFRPFLGSLCFQSE